MSLLQLCFTSFLLLLPLPSYSLNDEGLTLLSFKQSLQQKPSTTQLQNWNPSDTNPCSWEGIGCNPLGRVISLTLPYKQLAGSFHLDSTNLTQLRHVNLRSNNLTGTLPPELLQSPALKTLVLSENSISGPIPSEIGNADRLQTLDLSQNSFNGPLPPSILNCKRLKQLVLSSNLFSGSLPDGIGPSLITLQSLNLSSNAFTGRIPGDIGNLSNLQGALDLSHNFFTGAIPSSLGGLPETVYIDLSHNNLSGPIPQSRTLLDAGPTAFLGNPLLCGPPTKALCLSLPEKPKPMADDPLLEPGSGERRLSPALLAIAIVSGTVLAIGVVALSFAYWYKRAQHGKRNDVVVAAGGGRSGAAGKEMLCFSRRDDVESLASENVEQYAFLKVEAEPGFDLEQLLKASAFLLGNGGAGIMYKVVIENRASLAVRRLEDGGGGQRFREFQGEVEAIGKIRHPNIVRLLACCWCVSEKLLIYEYVPNGNLATAIHGRNGVTNFKPMPWSTRLRILKGLARGLTFIHECSPKRYVHGHLKPTSILLTSDMDPRIADFGLNRLACNPTTAEESSSESSRTPSQCSPYPLTPTNAKTNNASFYYEAPASSSKPSQKWDVYSYGMILLEIVTGKSPAAILNASEMDLGKWVQLSIDVSKPIGDIVDPFLAHDSGKELQMAAVMKIGLACVGGNPDKRPSMRNVGIALEKAGEE
ncbi:unnamed protein product [Linum tenue]|uniref:Protein kinase domain-containing protein n=1 Tax=Linum tenue TaxID=586396 RepID=A0AAV0MYM5_9ROSI|nr:unnamed protein product [Linum tenue]